MMSLSLPAPIAFAFHYMGLRVKVACGLHYTASPLSLRWRWQHWKHYRDMRRQLGR